MLPIDKYVLHDLYIVVPIDKYVLHDLYIVVPICVHVLHNLQVVVPIDKYVLHDLYIVSTLLYVYILPADICNEFKLNMVRLDDRTTIDVVVLVHVNKYLYIIIKFMT